MSIKCRTILNFFFKYAEINFKLRYVKIKKNYFRIAYNLYCDIGRHLILFNPKQNSNSVNNV